MQNRAFSKSQRLCKAISIYSWSSQDVGLEVFDVLSIFFSFDTEYIVLPSFCHQLLLSFQEWLLLIMKSTNTPTNIVVSSWLPVCFEKDLVGIPNFVNILIAIECMVVLPVGITKTETYWKRDYGIFHSSDVWKYASRQCSRVSGNVAPFRSVIFYILWLQYLWESEEDV